MENQQTLHENEWCDSNTNYIDSTKIDVVNVCEAYVLPCWVLDDMYA